MSSPRDRSPAVERLGRGMIAGGVLVWGIWLIVKVFGGEPEIEYFLPFHLAGVIPGSLLSRWDSIRRRWNNRRRR